MDSCAVTLATAEQIIRQDKKVTTEYLTEGVSIPFDAIGKKLVTTKDFVKAMPKYEKAIAAALLALFTGVAGTRLFKTYYKVFGKFAASQTNSLVRLILIRYLQRVKEEAKNAKKGEPGHIGHGGMRSINTLIANIKDKRKPLSKFKKVLTRFDKTKNQLYVNLATLATIVSKYEGDPEKQITAIKKLINKIAVNYKQLPLSLTLKAKLLPIIGFLRFKNKVAALLSFLPDKVKSIFNRLFKSKEKIKDTGSAASRKQAAKKKKREKAKKAVKKKDTFEAAFQAIQDTKIFGKTKIGDLKPGHAAVLTINSQLIPGVLGEIVAYSPEYYADKYADKKLSKAALTKIVDNVKKQAELVPKFVGQLLKELRDAGDKPRVRLTIVGPESAADYPDDFVNKVKSEAAIKKLVNQYVDTIELQKEIASEFEPDSEAYAYNEEKNKWYKGTVKKITRDGRILFKPEKSHIKAFYVDPVDESIMSLKDYSEKDKDGTLPFEDGVPDIEEQDAADFENVTDSELVEELEQLQNDLEKVIDEPDDLYDDIIDSVDF